ncbi:hypothetical protein OV450_0304 [Actinobacteria bacterium OV450]|nr:hypothetical protein OV450_0304 [Actinobacteria bacterium OV450]
MGEAGRRVAAGRSRSREGTFTLGADDDWTLSVRCTGKRSGVRLDGEELFPVRQGVAEQFAGGLPVTAPDGFTVRRRTLAPTAGTHRLAVSAEGGATGRRFRQLHTSGDPGRRPRRGREERRGGTRRRAVRL